MLHQVAELRQWRGPRAVEYTLLELHLRKAGLPLHPSPPREVVRDRRERGGQLAASRRRAHSAVSVGTPIKGLPETALTAILITVRRAPPQTMPLIAVWRKKNAE